MYKKKYGSNLNGASCSRAWKQTKTIVNLNVFIIELSYETNEYS